MIGAALFGIGWGLAGLCPGPAIAALAIRPVPALIVCLAMASGSGLFRLLLPPDARARGGRRNLRTA